jgi:hypothetical protein
MRARGTGSGIVVVGSLLALALSSAACPASATLRRGADSVQRLQCVPYARNASGIELVGNAWSWWGEAAGVYQRGHVPEPGAVLSFRANGVMRLGHVAVVGRVLNSREIKIDHANWGGGGISRDVAVIDVSENNDWTAVRVALGRSNQFGSIYPTHGFIYDRPDRQMLVASSRGAATAVPELNRVPRDLRLAAKRTPEVVTMTYDEALEEVAQDPATRHGRKNKSSR